MKNNVSTIDYLEKLDWVEVPMRKALNIWANNGKILKCVVGNSRYYYSDLCKINGLTPEQVQKGKWFVVKM